jgi:hypothetical protein
MEEIDDPDSDEKKIGCSYIIHKRAPNRGKWKLLMIIILLWSCFMVPLNIAFEKPKEHESWLRYSEVVVDIILLLDVIVNSVTDEYSSPGEKVTNLSIIKGYAASFMLFFDLIGCLPGLLTGETKNGGEWLYYLKLARLFKLATFSDGIALVLRFLLSNFQKHQIKNINLFIVMNFYFIIVWWILACAWVIIGRFEDSDGNTGWVKKEIGNYYKLDKEGNTVALVPEANQEIAIITSAFYFLVTTSTSVGYGDYFGTTMYERLFCIIVQFVGICIFSMMQD